jgi:Sulfotransferase domain
VYEVKEGWEPLCDFLGVEAPKDEPFPHLNDADSFRKMIRRRMVVAVLAGGAALLGLALLYLLSATSFWRA